MAAINRSPSSVEVILSSRRCGNNCLTCCCRDRAFNTPFQPIATSVHAPDRTTDGQYLFKCHDLMLPVLRARRSPVRWLHPWVPVQDRIRHREPTLTVVRPIEIRPGMKLHLVPVGLGPSESGSVEPTFQRGEQVRRNAFDQLSFRRQASLTTGQIGPLAHVVEATEAQKQPLMAMARDAPTTRLANRTACRVTLASMRDGPSPSATWAAGRYFTSSA